ncbi:PQQ-binding-like beta-propeller repeat protein [Nocardia sp. CA-107356]|uniref:outer membrane protein assembly factor BamB family protein n=1 Tax=Nocardia sp. CA-107356 TaxID=3239972 RepID=UPI003D931067
MFDRIRTSSVHPSPARVAFAVCTLLSGLFLLGCGSDQSAPPATSTVTSAANRPSFDPPKVFSAQAVSKINTPDPKYWSRECTLYDGTALCASRQGTLVATDPLNGKQAWQASPTVSPIGTSPVRDHGVIHAPIVHGDTVIAAFGGSVPASGTVPEKAAIEVIAVEVGTGRRLWNTVIDLGAASGSRQLPISTLATIKVVAVTANAVVITGRTPLLAGDRNATWVIDPQSHQIRWLADEFVAEYANDDAVIGDGKAGTGHNARRGRSIDDGREMWSAPVAGDGTRYLTANTPNVAFIERYKAFELVDPVTGQPHYTMSDPSADPLKKTWQCVYDQRQIIVCQNKTQILGFDITNPAKPLWEFGSDNSRVPPAMTAAYHGVIYGLNSSQRPIALDARTGQDLPDNPMIAPTLVDRYVGIAAVDVPGTFKVDMFRETLGWVYQPQA